ncbi:MAG: carboxyltransferase domain-containing protein [Armatimonadota bacterium]
MMTDVRARRLGETSWVVENSSSLEARSIALWLSEQQGITEAWPAFDHVGVEASCDVAALLQGFKSPRFATLPLKIYDIYVLYDLYDQYDLHAAANTLGLSPQELIALHTSSTFTVEAIGFSPGFAHMSGLAPQLCGLPRLSAPRKRVPVGAVALTETYCGVYPSASPGGWNIIGQTPLLMADLGTEFFPLRVGDQVRFTAIDPEEFQRREGTRLGD